MRVSGSRDARIAAIAALQRGRVNHRQLRLAEISRAQIAGLLRRDGLFAVHRGVYAVGHPGPVALGVETAALLAAGDDAQLSDRRAAALWDFGPAMTDGDPVQLLVGPTTCIRRAGIHARRSRFHGLVAPRVHRGLPVTSPAQTLLDLATTLSDAELVAHHSEATVKRLIGPRDCARVLALMPTHPGAARLTALLADAEAGVTESEAERRVRELIGRTDIPQPRTRVWILGYRLDFYWERARFGLEADGFRFHSSRRRFEADRVRDARLAAAGIEVMRVTWRQLVDEPIAVIARIAAAYARRLQDQRPVASAQPR